MKIGLLVLLIAGIMCKFHQKNKYGHRYRQKSKGKDTPKGIQLNNHFGSNTFNNPYGPRPELIQHEAFIKNPDGTVARKHIRQIIRGPEGQSATVCDGAQKEWYYACMNIRSCDICTASPHCGWCEITQQCVPQHLSRPACTNCINGWHFNTQSCLGQVKAGHFGHWAHDTDHVRTVEYTYPKYKLDSVYTAPQVVRTPVLLGNIQQNNTIEKTNVQKNTVVFTNSVVSNKPIYGEILQVLPVDVHSTQYIDTFSGKRVDNYGDHNIEFHGTDEYQFQNDFPKKEEIVPKRILATLNQRKKRKRKL